MKQIQVYYGDDKEIFARMESMSIYTNSSNKQFRMANLAIIGSAHVNGVSRLHTEILKKDIFKYFYEFMPEKFVNITNGITPRRWLLLANPSMQLKKKVKSVELAELITRLLKSEEWVLDLSKIDRIHAFIEDDEVLNEWREIKQDTGRIC